MQIIPFVTLLLIGARALAAEQPAQEVSISQPVEHVHHQAQQQPPTAVEPVSVVSVPVSGPSGVVGEPHHVSHVEHVHQPLAVPQHQQQHAGVHQYYTSQYQQPSSAGYVNGPSPYYSPAGLIQVVPASGSSSPSSSSSSSSVLGVGSSGLRHYAAGSLPASVSPVSSSSSSPSGSSSAEQYGQPESASIPANYKPFGSWGLYIGGNPADGYYTNYYKSLAVPKEQQSGAAGVVPGDQQVVGVAPKPGQQGPLLRQAFVSSAAPAVNGEPVYPYDHSYYTPSDLSSGLTRFASPAYVPGAGYGTPSASYDPGSSLVYSAAADSYGVKRLVQQQQQQTQQKEVQAPQFQQQQQHQQVQQQQAKGYQARSGYAYSAPVAAGPHQVVAYPVPVGSQIVGSQPGLDGAFYPHGVHAFTRYAVKPTVVSSVSVEPQAAYYQPSIYSTSSHKQPQQQQQQQQYHYQAPSAALVGHHQPLGFYGYPLSQLHYSTGFGQSSYGAVKPEYQVAGVQAEHYNNQPTVVVGGGESAVIGHHSPAGLVSQPNEAAASEKSETTHHQHVDKPAVAGDKHHHQQQQQNQKSA